MNTNQHDLSDDELDHLFSDAAEKMEIDFAPDSWSKMSQKLDAISSPKKAEKTGLKRGLLLLLALLFMFGAYYILKPSTDNAKLSQANNKINSVIESKKNDEKNVTTSKVETDNFENDINKNLEQGEIAKKDISTSESEVYENKKAENKVSGVNPLNENKDNLFEKDKNVSSKYRKNDFTKNENSVKPFTENKVVENTKSSKINRISQDKSREFSANSTSSETNYETETNKVLEKNKKENLELGKAQTLSKNEVSNQSTIDFQSQNSTLNNSTKTNFEENTGRLELKNLTTFLSKNAIFNANFSLPILTFNSPKVVAPAIPKSTSFKRGFYFRAAFSPDLSVVDKEELTKVGKNTALYLEYRFNKHWSMQSGLIRSTKYYNAYPESYVWPAKWVQPPAIVNINAICQMTDFPINIRYDISQKKNSRLFVSSGVTSYFMINEKYVYNYVNPTSPYIKNKGWNGKTGPYRFGVLNLSGGYEQQLFKRLSIQVEPFAKISLTKIGFGKVSLHTFGVFFSAKYPLVRF